MAPHTHPPSSASGRGSRAHRYSIYVLRTVERVRKLIRLVRAVRNWPRTLLDHLELADADYVCHLRNGLSFNIRGGTDDRHVIYEIFVEHAYDITTSPGDTIIDIGANIGAFTVWAAEHGARVLGYEPFPENFAALERNVARNNRQDIAIFKAAVGARRTTRQMFLPENRMHTGRYSLCPGRGSLTLDVPQVSLDDIVRENDLARIDILKLDCQGSEYEILYSTSAETLARTRRIIVECELFDQPPSWSQACLKAYLEGHGFRTIERGSLLHAERPVSVEGFPKKG